MENQAHEVVFLLERIQHWLTRMILASRKLPYDERIRQLGLWTLEERRSRAYLLQVFKMYKGLSSAMFSDFFTLSTSVTNTGTHRQDCKMQMPSGH